MFRFFLLLTMASAACRAADSLEVRLNSPMDYQVVQRQSAAAGKLIVAGTIVAEGGEHTDALQARILGKSAVGEDLPAQWQPLAFDPRVTQFRGILTVPAGGWYRLEVRAVRSGAAIATVVVEHVGIGEIFVVAGQSNAANYGETRHTNRTGRVAAFDGVKWQPAADPMPGAGGKKGSFMPQFGDAMADRFHVPIGLAALAVGSTSVREWLPATIAFHKLPPLTRNVVTVGAGEWASTGKLFDTMTARMNELGDHGFRAVLWHQGESDAGQKDAQRTLPGALYRQYLETIIRDSRRKIGWAAPWFVAQATYHNASDTGSGDIRDAQKAVCADGFALAGPDTDTLTHAMREKHGAGVHLSAEGLKAHASLWVDKVSPWLEKQVK